MLETRIFLKHQIDNLQPGIEKTIVQTLKDLVNEQSHKVIFSELRIILEQLLLMIFKEKNIIKDKISLNNDINEALEKNFIDNDTAHYFDHIRKSCNPSHHYKGSSKKKKIYSETFIVGLFVDYLNLLEWYYTNFLNEDKRLKDIYITELINQYINKNELIENIHITSLYINEPGLSSIFVPFLKKHHDYNVTYTCLYSNEITNGDLEAVEKCDLHLLLIGSENDYNKYVKTMQSDNANIENDIISIFVKEWEKSDNLDKKLLLFEEDFSFSKALFKNSIDEIRSRASNLLGKQYKFIPKYILNELEEFLHKNISEFMKLNGYINYNRNSSNNNSYNYKDKIDPVIPEEHSPLYINGFTPRVNKYNHELRNVVKELFIERHCISPKLAYKFIEITNKNLHFYVSEIQCKRIIGKHKSNRERLVFTDETLGWKNQDIWSKKYQFIEILKATTDVCRYLNENNIPSDLHRIFILDVQNENEVDDLFQANKFTDELILMQLILGVKLYFYPKSYIKKKIFDGDRNFFMIGKGQNSRLGIIDVKFPYIRLYKLDNELECSVDEKEKYDKVLNDSDRYDIKIKNNIHNHYVNFIGSTVDELLKNRIITISDESEIRKAISVAWTKKYVKNLVVNDQNYNIKANNIIDAFHEVLCLMPHTNYMYLKYEENILEKFFESLEFGRAKREIINLVKETIFTE